MISPVFQGPDLSVCSLTFVKTQAAKLDAPAASLIARGPGGEVKPPGRDATPPHFQDKPLLGPSLAKKGP